MSARESLMLRPEQLRRRLDPASLPFASTEEVEPLVGTIGQPRALDAIEYGLETATGGYNLFLAGQPGSGRLTTVLDYLEQHRQARPAPDDWVYVHNFDDPDRPNAIGLPAGRGGRLQRDMEEFVEAARREIPRAFESEEYDRRQREILNELGRRRNELTEELKQFALERGFALEIDGRRNRHAAAPRGRAAHEGAVRTAPGRAEEDDRGRFGGDRGAHRELRPPPSPRSRRRRRAASRSSTATSPCSRSAPSSTTCARTGPTRRGPRLPRGRPAGRCRQPLRLPPAGGGRVTVPVPAQAHRPAPLPGQRARRQQRPRGRAGRRRAQPDLLQPDRPGRVPGRLRLDGDRLPRDQARRAAPRQRRLPRARASSTC